MFSLPYQLCAGMNPVFATFILERGSTLAQGRKGVPSIVFYARCTVCKTEFTQTHTADCRSVPPRLMTSVGGHHWCERAGRFLRIADYAALSLRNALTHRAGPNATRKLAFQCCTARRFTRAEMPQTSAVPQSAAIDYVVEVWWWCHSSGRQQYHQEL